MEVEDRMIAAIAAIMLVGAGWFALRWQEESRRLDELIFSVKFSDEFDQ